MHLWPTEDALFQRSHVFVQTGLEHFKRFATFRHTLVDDCCLVFESSVDGTFEIAAYLFQVSLDLQTRQHAKQTDAKWKV